MSEDEVVATGVGVVGGTVVGSAAALGTVVLQKLAQVWENSICTYCPQPRTLNP